ncbi:MAG TPA: DUF1573 domain-containing protein [Chitinophagaceae bacterium]
MKKFTLFAAALFAFAAVNAQVNSTPEVKATQNEVKDITKVLSFKNDAYTFGKIPQGKPVEFDLEVKNISNDSVKIENVQVSCGCTTPKWQAGPYAPGEKFKITLGFNAAAVGPFSKSVTVFFSGGLTKTVTFNGETFVAPENAAPKNEAGKIKPGN